MNSSKIKKLFNDLLSDTRQLTRIVILAGVLLVLVVATFGGYYYYDRYYSNEVSAPEKIISQAQQAVEKNPQDPEARLGLAEAYMVNRRYDDALGEANQVMAAFPNNQHAWLVVGVANALKGNPKDAVEPLQKFYDANKDAEMPGLNKVLQSAAFYLGDSYLQLNQPDKAVPVLEKAVEWSQTDSDAMVKLGTAYIAVQRFENAVTMFQAATRFVPNYTEAYQGMAIAYQAMKEPAFTDYANGMVAYSKKDYKNALALLLKASQAEPEYVPALSGLGLTYEALNDLQSAKVSYEAALKLASEDFTAKSGLQRVESQLNK
jgi:tetratricopeptide (TPR) repeat protein